MSLLKSAKSMADKLDWRRRPFPAVLPPVSNRSWFSSTIKNSPKPPIAGAWITWRRARTPIALSCSLNRVTETPLSHRQRKQLFRSSSLELPRQEPAFLHGVSAQKSAGSMRVASRRYLGGIPEPILVFSHCDHWTTRYFFDLGKGLRHGISWIKRL